MTMIHVEPRDIPVPRTHHYLLGGVAPRPIALVSTLSSDGVPNLSPFSFFNAFSANPPIVVFSPARRGTDATTKDTYNNLVETKECVIQSVTHAMVQQVSLASTQYPPDVDEFAKSGLTPVRSDLVKPARVKESPFQMECVLRQMIPLGEGPAAGNLAVCEVVKFHIDEAVVRDGVIEPDLIDLVGRNSADYYTRASGSAVFEIEKPISKTGIGFDQLPDFVRNSEVLTANNLAQLANVESVPDRGHAVASVERAEPLEADKPAFDEFERDGDYRRMFQASLYLIDRKHPDAQTSVERTARAALQANDPDFAWAVLLYADSRR